MDFSSKPIVVCRQECFDKFDCILIVICDQLNTYDIAIARWDSEHIVYTYEKSISLIVS